MINIVKRGAEIWKKVLPSPGIQHERNCHNYLQMLQKFDGLFLDVPKEYHWIDVGVGHWDHAQALTEMIQTGLRDQGNSHGPLLKLTGLEKCSRYSINPIASLGFESQFQDVEFNYLNSKFVDIDERANVVSWFHPFKSETKPQLIHAVQILKSDGFFITLSENRWDWELLKGWISGLSPTLLNGKKIRLSYWSDSSEEPTCLSVWKVR